MISLNVSYFGETRCTTILYPMDLYGEAVVVDICSNLYRCLYRGGACAIK